MELLPAEQAASLLGGSFEAGAVGRRYRRAEGVPPRRRSRQELSREGSLPLVSRQNRNTLKTLDDHVSATELNVQSQRLVIVGNRSRIMVQRRDPTQSSERAGDPQGVVGPTQCAQAFLQELAAEIEKGRLLTMHAAWKLDSGDKAQKEVSMAKIHVADVLHKAADTGIQLNGARGYSKDTVLEWIYRYARCAKLVDGASEVHKMVLARAYAKQGNDFWSWG